MTYVTKGQSALHKDLYGKNTQNNCGWMESGYQSSIWITYLHPGDLNKADVLSDLECVFVADSDKVGLREKKCA